MRDWSVRLFLFLLVLTAACSSAPAVSVVRNGHPDDEAGDPIKLKRPDQEFFAGGKAGFHVVRTHDDWNDAWPLGKVPNMPEFGGKDRMMFIATAESRSTIDIKINRAIESAEMIYVFATEQKLGENCLKKEHDRAFDAVNAPRVNKPVRFYVATQAGESCGPPPSVSVECRLSGQEKWSGKITAQPGDVVECTLAAQSTGKFELIGRDLSIGGLPAGSAAKFKFKGGDVRGTYEVDVYGDYVIKAEAMDEGGRHATATATVEVKPPKTKDVLVQLVWSGFDIKDSSDTFPHVDLRVTEPGARGQRCTADIPVAGLCDVKTRGAYSYMTIPAGDRKLPISVQYLDPREEKGAAPCVHVWFDGQRTAETCDHAKREGEEIWRVGTLDTSTGKLSNETMPDDAAKGAKPGAKPAPAPAPKKK